MSQPTAHPAKQSHRKPVKQEHILPIDHSGMICCTADFVESVNQRLQLKLQHLGIKKPCEVLLCGSRTKERYVMPVKIENHSCAVVEVLRHLQFGFFL